MKHLTYANVIATLALFIALGGVSYAAIKLPKNSVGANQLKKNSVTAAKLKSGAVTGEKIATQTLGSVPNATHAATADNASALGGAPASAFATADVVRSATISSKGILDPALSVGITQANVLHKETGVYCINGLNPPPRTAIGNGTFGGESDADVVTRVENEPNCQTAVIVFAGPANNPTDQPFTIFLR